MHSSGGRYALNRNRLRLLQRIVEETGCEILLSSTWRNDVYALRRLKRVLGYRGIKIKDVTVNLHRGEDGKRFYRGHEIQEYLDRHPEIETYVIVDDDSDMLDSQLRNFVQTDGEIGLTNTLAYRIIYKLNNGVEHIQ